MANEATLRRTIKEYVQRDKEEHVCQYCPFHQNKPSYCEMHKIYVPRKAKACESMQVVNKEKLS